MNKPIPFSTTKAELGPALAAAFPRVAALGREVSPMTGGRAEAERLLSAVDPLAYARSRNFLDGAVTGLAPYLRHGVLTLTEVLQAGLRKVRQAAEAEKLVSELAWRDYYQRVYGLIGQRVWDDLEAGKTGWDRDDYADDLPADVQAGQTGLACMDGFASDLRSTGYLHNHARMWVAAYVVHHRRVKWQAGAKWFLHHLLDGDVASNNLSWQWVASTFSHKPYFFNRENLERYSGGRHCAACPAKNQCPFEGSYDALSAKLFPHMGRYIEESARPVSLWATSDDDPSLRQARRSEVTLWEEATAVDPAFTATESDAVAWVHEDALRPGNAALMAAGPGRAVTVLDEEYFAGQGYSLKRVAFIAESAAEITEVRLGRTVEAVIEFAREKQASRILTTSSVNPAIRGMIEQLAGAWRVTVLQEVPFVTLQGKADLTRFSRYWRKAERQLLD